MVSFKMTQNNMRRILQMHNGAQLIYNKKLLGLNPPVPALSCQMQEQLSKVISVSRPKVREKR